MAICTILDQKIDSRKNGDDCEFNGYLEDYLNLGSELEPALKEALEKILASEPDAKICVNLRSEINQNAISNQIIRYKDIFKLTGKAMEYPYIIYVTRETEQRALLVVPAAPYSFIYAKGCYYCMTEPGSPFIDCKNEIVAVSSDKSEVIVDAWDKIFKMKAGALQRSIDRRFFASYDDLKNDAVKAANELKEEAPEKLAAVSGENRQEEIYQYVIKWFLLKKVLYVQYMVNKNILNTVHEGNVKKQRNQAKLNADEISFLSFSEMWRMTREQADQMSEAEEKTEAPAEPAAEEPKEN
ncbi:MAG: hypothetical protein LKF79_08050 [Solobacterium sp.]|jgi:hypothetical protein|nr:hypothetical protein [Solobacterium sp.]MCH4223150.1 hypothetical protein [Solobacterium sp.]MCH4266579.1 hypothetical protein [Solobacterium sp.]